MLKFYWHKSAISRQLENFDRHVGGQRIFLTYGHMELVVVNGVERLKWKRDPSDVIEG